MAAGEGERPGPITLQRQRPEVTQREPATQGVALGQLAPPRDGRIMAACPGGIGRERVQRGERQPRQPMALLLDPPVELGIVLEIEAVEERPARQRDRPFPVTRVHGSEKSGDIGREDRLVQDHPGPRGADRVATESDPDRVQRLTEGVPSAVVGRVRPEEGQEPFSRHASIPGRRNHGEQGQARRSQPRRDRGIIGLDCQAAESPKLQHVTKILAPGSAAVNQGRIGAMTTGDASRTAG